MDPIIDPYWLVCPLIILCAYVFGVPLIILKVFKHEANPTLQLIDPEEFPLPTLVQQHFDAMQSELARAGFAAVGTLLLPSQMPNVRALVRIYVNRAAQESAMVSSVFGLVNGQVSSQMQYVEFCTRYISGQEFNTGNASSGGGAFPPRLTTLTVHIPRIKEVGELYKIHQAITRARGPAARKELRLDTVYRGDLAAYVAGGMRDELEQAAQAGYLRLTSSGTEYRATIKGAYVMTWKQMWPFKSVVAARRRQAVETLLAEVGVR